MSEADLIGEQFKHAIDLLVTKNDFLVHRIAELEKAKEDHETRLRAVETSATQHKVLTGLVTGGGLMGIIALIRTIAD